MSNIEILRIAGIFLLGIGCIARLGLFFPIELDEEIFAGFIGGYLLAIISGNIILITISNYKILQFTGIGLWGIGIISGILVSLFGYAKVINPGGIIILFPIEVLAGVLIIAFTSNKEIFLLTGISLMGLGFLSGISTFLMAIIKDDEFFANVLIAYFLIEIIGGIIILNIVHNSSVIFQYYEIIRIIGMCLLGIGGLSGLAMLSGKKVFIGLFLGGIGSGGIMLYMFQA